VARKRSESFEPSIKESIDAPRKKRKYEKAIEESIDLSPETKKILLEHMNAATQEFQDLRGMEVQAEFEARLKCPCKFINNRQCKNTRRSKLIDPEEFCAKCRAQVDKKNMFYKRPLNKTTLSLSIDEVSDGEDV